MSTKSSHVALDICASGVPTDLSESLDGFLDWDDTYISCQLLYKELEIILKAPATSQGPNVLLIVSEKVSGSPDWISILPILGVSIAVPSINWKLR